MPAYKPLRVRIKDFLKRVLPSTWFEGIRTLWIRFFSRYVNDAETIRIYTSRFLSQFPPVVQAGPFQGMRYVHESVGSSYLHKLIGSYEAVLHPYIDEIGKRTFDTVIDIGTAEGYYLIGFGRMFPQAQLIGFETEEKGRVLCKELYTINGLYNPIMLRGSATRESIATLITRHTLLICDCEGQELDILDTTFSTVFFDIDVAIIELHDFIRPGIKNALQERFKDTHNISIVRFELADPSKFPFLASVTDAKALYELRRERACQEQEWMILDRKRA